MIMMGGKFRQGPKIVEYIRPFIHRGAWYYEPFCGAMGVAHRMAAMDGIRMFLSDGNEAIVTMWEHLLRGWNPPDVITRDMFDLAKAVQDPKDPITAYCGHGMSWAGAWFRSYNPAGIADDGVNYEKSRTTKESVMRKVVALFQAEVHLRFCDYTEVIDTNSIFYLDPPYDVGKSYHGSTIDHSEFWEYADMLVGLGNEVFVTEFKAPDHWERIYSWGDTTKSLSANRRKGIGGVVESIWRRKQ